MQRRSSLPPEPNKALCPSCHKQKSPNEAQCDICGTRACLRCSNVLSPGSRICPICGWVDRQWKPPARGYSPSIKAPDLPIIPGERIDFICPNCKIKTSPKSGHCPNCGYLIDVEQDITAGDSTTHRTSDSQQMRPPSQASTAHEQIPSKLDVKFGHSCPQCGDKIDPRSDRCPNCGHMGPMQHDIAQQQSSKIPSTSGGFVPPTTPQSPAAQQFQPIPEVAQGRSCPSCGNRISPDSRICPHCNANIGSRRPTPPLHAISAAERAMGNISHPASPAPSTGPSTYGAERAQSNISHPASPVPSAGPSMYRAESTAAKVAGIPFPDKSFADKAAKDKPKERKYRAKRSGFPMGLLAAIIVVAAALIGMVIYVASQEFKPPVTSTVDNSAFKISKISTSSITENGAVITWTTDKSATSQVQLCEGDILCLPWTDIDKELVTAHSVTMQDLKEDTLYHVSIRSLDADKNEVISDKDVSFTTLEGVDSSTFSINAVEVVAVTETSATIEWTTNREATSQLDYGTTTSYGMKSTDNNMIKNHSVVLSDLEPNTSYYYKITVKDISNIERTYIAEQSFTTNVQITVGINIGNRAPNISLSQLGGGTIDLSDLAGKIVMVNFWYTTCGPCVEEMPEIQEVFDTWDGNKELVILAVNRKDNATEVQGFVNNHGLTFPILLDLDGLTNALYSVAQWPTTYFIDTERIIRDVKIGTFASSDEILEKLESIEN